MIGTREVSLSNATKLIEQFAAEKVKEFAEGRMTYTTHEYTQDYGLAIEIVRRKTQEIRAEALEEAAKVCEEMGQEERDSGMPGELAYRIRALKDRKI